MLTFHFGCCVMMHASFFFVCLSSLVTFVVVCRGWFSLYDHLQCTSIVSFMAYFIIAHTHTHSLSPQNVHLDTQKMPFCNIIFNAFRFYCGCHSNQPTIEQTVLERRAKRWHYSLAISFIFRICTEKEKEPEFLCCKRKWKKNNNGKSLVKHKARIRLTLKTRLIRRAQSQRIFLSRRFHRALAEDCNKSYHGFCNGYSWKFMRIQTSSESHKSFEFKPPRCFKFGLFCANKRPPDHHHLARRQIQTEFHEKKIITLLLIQKKFGIW